MREEAKKILAAFHDQGVHVGDFIHFTDFGEAIVWEEGFVRDEAVRHALAFLIDKEYVVELITGLGLTEKGEDTVFGSASS